MSRPEPLVSLPEERARPDVPARAGMGRRPPTFDGRAGLGAALDLRRDALGTFLRAMHEHGDVVGFVAGPPGLRQRFVMVFHPDGVQHVLARAADRYRKDNVFYQEVRELLGEGLLTSQDARWQAQRRLLQPFFTRRRLAAYVPLMAEESERVASRWRARAAEGGEVDLHGAMVGLTFRVIARALFGADADRALPAVEQALPVLGHYVFRRGFAPVRTPQHWPTPANRRAAEARALLTRTCDDLIAARRGSGEEHADLLGVLLAARDEHGTALSDRDIREQVLIFLLAGHDTTGLALTYALHLVGRHPAVQSRLRVEARAVLGDGPPDADVIARLPYAAMVLQEAMRLFPPVYGSGRRVTGDDRIGPFRIPAGTDVLVCPWATHRHPAFWPDPERFDPERFSPAAQAGRHPYAYFPFGGGPRMCIGRAFSLLEGTLALATLIRDVHVATQEERVALDPQVTLHPAGPVPARLAPVPAAESRSVRQDSPSPSRQSG